MEVSEKRAPLTRLVSIIDGYEKRLSEVSERGDIIATKTIEVASNAEAEKPQKPSKSILIVDENYLTETLKIILQIVGYKVDTARYGVQALKKALDKPYDLVIIEVNLPDSIGREIAQVIRNMNHGTKVILMTGDEFWEETMKSTLTEVDYVLLKPFAPEELVSVTRRILGPRTEKDEKPKLKLPLS